MTAHDPHGGEPLAHVLTQWAAVPLRLMIGYGLVMHALAKLSRGPDAFAAVLGALSVPAPHLMSWVTIAIELLCGLAVMLGAFVAAVSVPLTVVLVVAIVSVHLPFGFSSVKLVAVTEAGPQFGKPGVETALLYIAGLATLVMGGPGPWSIDSYRKRRAMGGRNEGVS